MIGLIGASFGSLIVAQQRFGLRLGSVWRSRVCFFLVFCCCCCLFVCLFVGFWVFVVVFFVFFGWFLSTLGFLVSLFFFLCVCFPRSKFFSRLCAFFFFSSALCLLFLAYIRHKVVLFALNII